MTAEHVLLLPGMMCDERLFEPQMDTINVPMHVGDTTRDDSFAAMARRALAEAPDRFAIVGLSMGGILAFEIWRQAPDRVTHLALLDTNPHADSAERRSMRAEQIAQVLKGGLRSLAIDSLKPAYLAEANRDDDDLLETILAMALDLGADVFERQSIALKERIDSVATLATIDCPTTILCGAEDRLCPVEYHELMAERIPGARLVVVDDCGHLATLEQPAVVTRELERLLVQ